MALVRASMVVTYYIKIFCMKADKALFNFTSLSSRRDNYVIKLLFTIKIIKRTIIISYCKGQLVFTKAKLIAIISFAIPLASLNSC